MARTITSPDSKVEHATAISRFDRFVQRLYEPVDIDFLVYFRVVFGAVMVYQMLSYFTRLKTGETLIDFHYLAPFQFKYIGFEWVKPLPPRLTHIEFGVLGVLAAGIAVGFLYRACAVLFFLGWMHLFLLDKVNFQNHYYLVCQLCFWMMLFPANRAFSIDSTMRPQISSAVTPKWVLWVLRLQIGIPYFFGGIAKINSDWLHGEPMRAWIYGGKYSYIPLSMRTEAVVWAYTYAGMMFDLLIVPALLWRRTRLLACGLAIFFHVSNHFIYPIGIFPWLMLFSLVVYFPPGTVRRLAGRWLFSPAEQTTTTARRTSTGQRWFVTFLIAYFSFQAMWPLRHHLYPGDAGWTGEGDLFAWRMMLYTKGGESPKFEIYDPDRNAVVEQIESRWFLNPRQAWKMQLCPDMIAQFAKFVHEKILAPKGLERYQVRVRVPVTYNGREPELLVDPNVDMAKVEVYWWQPADWIMPLTKPLPAHDSYMRKVKQKALEPNFSDPD